MKKISSKLLALFLSIAMVVTMIPTAAYAEITEADKNEDYYVWDFSEGSATNTSGVDTNNTLSLVKTSISGVTEVSQLLSDGTLNFSKQTTLQMSEGVTVTDDHDWKVDFVAKGDGTTTPRSFLSTTTKIADGVYLYIDGKGDLSIVKKGDYTDDNGTARSGYVYYKVSNDDYNASVLASGDFDIKEYHTYELQCNDGVFSYWLDGTKVGNYALSETTALRGGSTGYTGGTGTPFDFSDLTFNYIGCGNSSNATTQAFTGTIKSLGFYTVHDFEEVSDTANCISGGIKTYKCADCDKTKTETTYATTGYTWDFAQGSATNTGGVDLNNELSLVKGYVSGGKGTTISSMSDLLSDGTLNATGQTTLKMSESVTLSSNNDWTIELTAKGDGTNPMRSFLSTEVTIGDATYLYIDGNGDLSIVKKGSYTDDKGTARSGYTYYKVSNDSYNNSVLASGNFDITQYHNYQLRCIDGVYSFWLDGTKVGDYALSETTSNRGGSTGYTQGNGTPFDFSNLTFNYVGCGSTKDAASQGFTGTIKFLGVYTGHNFVQTSTTPATHNSRGEIVYTCTGCGETKTEYISATTGYTWDFSEGSATNTGGVDLNNELSLVKGYVSGGKGTTISSMSDLLSDGTLNATGQTTLKMSESVTLSSNNDWTIELTAKGDGTTTMRSFLSTSKLIGDATYLYIDGNGDLSIVKKGDYTDDNGTARSGYTYYKVSNSDYNNSALKSGDFDITEYHTYQIRCINGTFSFWLDGTKIGDYALSETTPVRGGSTGYTAGSGTPFDFSNLTFNYLGCGNTSDSASQGFTGTVKYLGIYTNDYFDIEAINGTVSDDLGFNIYVNSNKETIPDITYFNGFSDMTVSAKEDTTGEYDYVYELTKIQIGYIAGDLNIRIGDEPIDIACNSVYKYYQILTETSGISEQTKQIVSTTAKFASQIQQYASDRYSAEVDMSPFENYVVSNSPAASDNIKSTTISATNPSVYKIRSATVEVGNAVSLIFLIKADQTEVDAGNVYLYIDGEKIQLGSEVLVDAENSIYSVCIQNIEPINYGKTYTAVLKLDDGAEGKTDMHGIQYSVNSYCYQMNGSSIEAGGTTRGALALALYNFGKIFN